MIRYIVSGVVVALGLIQIPAVSAQDHDFHNQSHGAGTTVQANPPTADGLHVEFRWRNLANADLDGHVRLPDNEGPYVVTSTINFSRPDQPFANGPQVQRVYPSQAGVTFSNGQAFAMHSGDQGGNAPAGIGCVEPAGGSCEIVSITGQVPTGQYGVGIHNFNANNLPGSAADYDIIVHATNGAASISGQETHLSARRTTGRLTSTGESHIGTIDFFVSGNGSHAIGVSDFISTQGYAVAQVRNQVEHKAVEIEPIEQAVSEIRQAAPSLLRGNTENEMLAYYAPRIQAGEMTQGEFMLIIQQQHAAQNANLNRSVVLFDKERHLNRNEIQMMPEYSFKQVETLVGIGLAVEMDPDDARLHQETSPDNSNIKFVSSDGRYEWVFTKNEVLITEGPDAGSYNYSPFLPGDKWYSLEGVSHFRSDMLPYYMWGNRNEDNTTWLERVYSF